MNKPVLMDKLIDMPIREQIGRAKAIPEKDVDERFAAINKEMEKAFNDLTEEGDLDA